MTEPSASFEQSIKLMRRMVEDGIMRLFLKSRFYAEARITAGPTGLQELLQAEGIDGEAFDEALKDVRTLFCSAISDSPLPPWVSRDKDAALLEQKVAILKAHLVTDRLKEVYLVKATSKAGVLNSISHNVEIRHHSDGADYRLPYAAVEIGMNDSFGSFGSDGEKLTRFQVSLDELEYLLAYLQDVRDRLLSVKAEG